MKIALVCIAKNEDNYIKEWVDYHKKIGFDKIFIFENNWVCNIIDDVVVKIKFDGEMKQVSAYNYFIENFKDVYDWCLFIDVDEFLVLKNNINVKDFIRQYGNVENGIAINWVLFGNNNHTKVIGNNYSVLDRFTKRQKNINQHIKTFLKLKNKNVKMVDPHHPNVTIYDTNLTEVKSALNPRGVIDVVQINHYFCKTEEEFMLKINRGRADILEKRNFNDWHVHNTNEIDDFFALQFYKNN
jgi:predicted HAD superfamily phosphohydrolase YqeG